MAATKPSRRRRPSQPAWRGQWPLFATVGAVLVVVAVFAYLAGHQAAPKAAPKTVDTVITKVTTPNPAVASAVGTGGVSDPLKPATGLDPLRDSSGKPAVLYVGAEYCPFCAAERWSLVYALARFGSFGGLVLSTSSSTDAYPDTPTFSFRSSSYQSTVLAFTAVELSDRQGNQLQALTAAQQTVTNKLDPAGSIPFLDLGNRYSQVGAGYQPAVLGGLSWDQIAAQLSDPSSPVAKAVVGNANYITAAICRLTGDQPAATCGDPVIQKIEAGLG
jgi:hypothetical protein